MPIEGRRFHKGEKPHHVYDRYRGHNKYNQYFYIRVAIIEEIDLDKYEMTIQWVGKRGVRDKIPISFPYVGPAGIIGMLPEKGALGIFAFMDEGEGKGNPICVGFLPAGLSTALNFNDVQIYPDSLPTSDVNKILYKFRKLSYGDVIISSPLFASFFLNSNVEIHDAVQDSFIIRQGDQSIISTSLNNFIFADGISINMGHVIRNGLELYDKDGTRLDNKGSILTIPESKDIICITKDGEPIDYQTEYYTEYRIDVDEFGNGKLDLNDINSSSVSLNNPIVTFVLGNYIGSDRINRQQYGRNLKASLFKSYNDANGDFSLEIANDKNGIDEAGTIGLAYALHFLDSKCFLGIDKEGHYYMNLPASSSNNDLGAGSSMSILAQGSLKEVWGSNAAENNSWNLSTNGGVIWDLGAHSPSRNSRSFEMKTSRGIYFEINGADDDGYSKREEITGNTLESISGDATSVSSNFTLEVNGLKTEKIGGSFSESIQSDKNTNVLGVYTETVVKEKQCKFGKRKTTITTGNDELEITKGNREEMIILGKKISTVRTGNIEQNVNIGNHETSITTGNYKVNVSAGNITHETSAGTVNISGTSAKIKGNISIAADAPIVKLGGALLIGGVVSGLPGKITHYDFVTGAPLKGSLKVSAG